MRAQSSHLNRNVASPPNSTQVTISDSPIVCLFVQNKPGPTNVPLNVLDNAASSTASAVNFAVSKTFGKVRDAYRLSRKRLLSIKTVPPAVRASTRASIYNPLPADAKPPPPGTATPVRDPQTFSTEQHKTFHLPPKAKRTFKKPDYCMADA